MKDARWFPIAALYALLGTVVHVWTVSHLGSVAREVPLGVGFAWVWFLLVVTGFGLTAHRGPWRGKHISETVANWSVGGGVLVLGACHLVLLPIALVYTAWHEAWGMLPLLVAAQGIGLTALAVLLRRLPWRGAGPEARRPRVPLLLGVDHPDRMPSGWVPVVVHRPDRLFLDAAIDYAVEVDGRAVDLLAPGDTLVIGLPPGGHTVRLDSGWTGRPLAFTASPGTTVHLLADPGEPIAWPLSKLGPRIGHRRPSAPRQEQSA
ncbi:hypothetical protein [Nocardiopsis protaetiae]|uniref:hypothetical protein n=1 Tax=Nocardiopsis protaetiae TaxID=3382270 RepID=UPI00387A9746